MTPKQFNAFDVIKNPSHYVEGREYEPRKVIADWRLNFNLGNVIKYVSRSGRKYCSIRDLEKARQYLDFEIEEQKKLRSEYDDQKVQDINPYYFHGGIMDD